MLSLVCPVLLSCLPWIVVERVRSDWVDRLDFGLKSLGRKKQGQGENGMSYRNMTIMSCSDNRKER